jgi:hypothetical protein
VIAAPGACYSTAMTVTIRSSTLSDLSDLAVLSKEAAPGRAVELTDVGLFVARREDIHALADQLAEEELLEHMASFRKDATGVENTIWLSPKGRTRHAARVKVAIDPPHTLDATSETASVAVHDGSLVEGNMSSGLLEQVRRFIALNREAIIDYWENRIDTCQLVQSLRAIEGR